MCRYLVAVTLFALIRADKVSFLTKCKSNDDNCLKESTTAAIPIFAAGIPEFEMNALDPAFFKRIDSSTPVLNFLVDNATADGFRKCIATKVHRDIKKSKILLKALCDGGMFHGRYMMSGQLLKVAIEGHGKINVDLKNGEIEIEMDIDNIQGKDGKNHWNIKNWKYTYDLKGKSTVYFENLFNKDSLLGQTAEEMVASNGNAVIKDVGRPIITAIMTNIVDKAQRFFHAVPSEDLTID